MFIETNLLLEDNHKEGEFIAYSSDWISIKELSDYKNISMLLMIRSKREEQHK